MKKPFLLRRKMTYRSTSIHLAKTLGKRKMRNYIEQKEKRVKGKKPWFFALGKRTLSFDLAPIRNHPKKNKEEFV